MTFTSQEARLNKDNLIHFPKTLKGFTLNPQCIHKENFISYQQVRFVPKSNHIVAEIIYKISSLELKIDNGKYASIDLGIDNLVTLANNFGAQPIILSGKPIKAINQWYNKLVAHYQSCLKFVNDQYNSHSMALIFNLNYIYIR